MRATLVRIAESRHVLAIVAHHIVVDAWSMAILRRDLSEFYRAEVERRSPSLPELDVQYADFAVWQREWLSSGSLEEQVGYWTGRLAGAPDLIELPADHPRPTLQSDRGGHARALLPRDLTARLENLASEGDATLFMTLLAAFALLLSRWGDQADVVVGTPVANRQRTELEPLIGFFANTLALRIDLGGNPSFRDLLQRVRTVVVDAMAHQDLPFEQLVAELNPSRSLSHSPLFQVLFQLQMPSTMESGSGITLPGLDVERLDVERGKAKFDLALTMQVGRDGLHASFEYSTDLFEPQTAKRMLGHLETLLASIAADPDSPVGELSFLTETERAQSAEWNLTTVAHRDIERPVHELFELQAAKTPSAVAVTFRGECLEYAELNARANRLATYLRGLGVAPDVPVAIAAERSLELVVAVLAILKAGGAYCPLDPAYPSERLSYMLDQASPAVLLTSTSIRPSLPATDARVLCIDEMDLEKGESVEDMPTLARIDDLAYILFTSGSTGWPKGVAMPHRPLANLLLWQREHFSARADARTLQFASLSFDVAFQEIFSTLTCGGTLVLVDDDTRRDTGALLDLLDDERIERLFMPFAILQHLAEVAVDRGLYPVALREVITAGEALQASPAIRHLFAGLEGCMLHNHYGPTESHVVTAYTLDGPPDAWPALPPIGKPIANARIYLLDANDQPVPVGVPGQLHIGGPVLAREYLNRPDLTAERFSLDPFGGPGERLYRTGDLAKYREDGTIEYLGRRDDQVKVRGHRVELGEIESVLLRHEELREAAVVVREDAGGERRLVGYVVPETRPGPAAAELRDFVRRYVPEFMVPVAFVELDALPLGATGKIDRRALPAPDSRQGVERELVIPRTETERRLVRIWQDVIGITEPIGIDDDFFGLGGHSLLAVRLVARVERSFGVKVPLATLFEDATVQRMAQHVTELAETGQRLPTLTPLKSSGTKPPLFVLHGHDGQLMIYRELVGSMSADQPVFGIQPVGLDGRQLPFLSLQEMAAHYAAELRRFLPEGPYLLAGYCFSGSLAYEVAHQLAEHGRPPALLALIDASPLGHRRVGRATLERAKFRDFLSRDLRGKGRWIARRAGGLTYKFRTRLWFALYGFAARGVRWVPRSLLNVEGAIMSARKAYRTPSSSLRVTLLRAVDGNANVITTRSDWRALAGEVEIRPIVAAGIRHDTIVRHPYVELLAAELEACIDRALARGDAAAEAVSVR